MHHHNINLRMQSYIIYIPSKKLKMWGFIIKLCMYTINLCIPDFCKNMCFVRPLLLKGQPLETTVDLMRLRIHAHTQARAIVPTLQHTFVKHAAHPLGRVKNMLMYE